MIVKYSNVQEGCIIGLNNKLYVKSFKGMVNDFKFGLENKKSINAVYIAYFNKEPIAAGVVKWNNFISIYVKPAHRRNGYGSKIIQFAQQDFDRLISADGVKGSRRFFKNNGVE